MTMVENIMALIVLVGLIFMAVAPIALLFTVAIDGFDMSKILIEYKDYRESRKKCAVMGYKEFSNLRYNEKIKAQFPCYNYEIKLSYENLTARVVLKHFWDYRKLKILKKRAQQCQAEEKLKAFLEATKEVEGENSTEEVESCEF